MGEWRTIESAPKDGTIIDLWDAYYGCRVNGARWDCHYWYEGKPQGEKSWGRDGPDGPFCPKPTHWMPPPSPPNAAKTVGARAIGEWMPIETAPKDGTRILVYGKWAGEINGPCPTPVVGVAKWTGGRTDYHGFDWDCCNTDAYAAWWKPTHWQPLPPPPDAGGQG